MNAKYILKNSQPGLSQNHPKHGFLQVSQIIPLCFFPYLRVCFFEFSHLSSFIHVFDLMKQGHEIYMN